MPTISGRRLPKRSDSGPATSWPLASPIRQAVTVSCAAEAGASRSRASSGSTAGTDPSTAARTRSAASASRPSPGRPGTVDDGGSSAQDTYGPARRDGPSCCQGITRAEGVDGPDGAEGVDGPDGAEGVDCPVGADGSGGRLAMLRRQLDVGAGILAQSLDVLLGQLAADLGGDAGDQRAGRDLHALGDHGAGRDQAAGAHSGAVEHHGAD